MSAPNNSDRCKNCMFFVAGEFSGDAYDRVPNRVYGRCHRFPPQTTDNSSTLAITSHWPKVTGSDWCGEFKVDWPERQG